MDYRELLKKYMEHVGDCEGTCFLLSLNDHTMSEIEFTQEEIDELNAIGDEPLP